MAATVHGAHGQSGANLANIHNQLASGSSSGSDKGSGLAFGSHATVPSSAPQSVSGGHGPVSFAGQSSPTEHVVATQEVQPGGGVTLQLSDGSSINVLGASHVDSSLFHK